MHASICCYDNLNHQDKWGVRLLITQPLHQRNAENLKGMNLSVAAVNWETPLFGLLKTFMGRSESRQMGVPSCMTYCSADLRESALPAIQETDRLLCAQELEESIREHLREV
jgi:hypothetical protein